MTFQVLGINMMLNSQDSFDVSHHVFVINCYSDAIELPELSRHNSKNI